MKTLTVLSRKGGTGKSTLTACLAITASRRGWTVLVADADPQASAAYALQARAPGGPGVIRTCGGKVHQVKFAAEVQGVDLLIIDTPGAADANALHAIHAADLCLMVTRPNYFDLASAVESATTVRQLGKRGLVVVNQAPFPRGEAENPSVRNAREALLFTRFPVAATTLRQRVAFQASIAQGLTPEEADPAGPAAAEIAQLWAELACALHLPAREAARAG